MPKRMPVRRKRQHCKKCGKLSKPRQTDPMDRVCRCHEVGVNRPGQKHLFRADSEMEENDEEWLYYAMVLGLNPFEKCIEMGRTPEWTAQRLGLEIYYGSF